MPTNTHFRIEVHLNRPAFLHLFWIDTQGKLYRVHGWAEDSWRPLASLEPAPSLRLPADNPGTGPQWIPLEGTAGTETVVLLAGTAPLDRALDELWPEIGAGLEGKLSAAVKSMPRDPSRGYEFTCRQEEFEEAAVWHAATLSLPFAVCQ